KAFRRSEPVPIARQDAYALVMLDRVVNHFTEKDSFANAGAAKQSCLSATLERHQHIFPACFIEFALSFVCSKQNQFGSGSLPPVNCHSLPLDWCELAGTTLSCRPRRAFSLMFVYVNLCVGVGHNMPLLRSLARLGYR